jgi:predicted nucleotidyltransferase component of viral defense system
VSVNPKSSSLKAKIRNIAKERKISPQVLLQNYMFERFLERISLSEYMDKFVVKGGALIAAMVGLETRSTMDIDASVRAYPLDTGHIRSAIEAICSVNVEDGVRFSLNRIGQIRRHDEYGGIRVILEGVYDAIVTRFSVDITSGDAITPAAIRYGFKTLFDEEKRIDLWAYNVETLLAEKVETILRRGIFNGRSRDFYDVYILVRTQKFSFDTFRQALRATSAHRRTTEQTSYVPSILRDVENSVELKSLWANYQDEYAYARDVDYQDIMTVLKSLLDCEHEKHFEKSCKD